MPRPARLHIVGTPAIMPSSADPYAGVHASGDDYDSTEFYVTGINKHDHSVTKHIRFDPIRVGEVDRLIASGGLLGTPITSFGDFMRDAMVHQMYRVARLVNDPQFTEAAEDARRLARAEAMVRERETKQKIVGDCKDALAGAMDAHDRSVVHGLLELYEPMVDRMRQPYAAQMEALLGNARRWLTNNAS